ncbi:sialidase family protein [Tahibacter caeni]|uniref:sialidase family protein n=1 Tax=Tahibacter caeni TaxID=1453545 RepID=UPI0021489B18|nr:sialidase family protein [Tahibacter caeni]
MNCRSPSLLFALLLVLAVTSAGAAPVWQPAVAPPAAAAYAGMTTASGRQLLGGSWSGLYVRDSAAAPWQKVGGVNSTWSLARDAGGRLYAAGEGAMVAHSDDDGQNWTYSFLPCCTLAVYVGVTPGGAVVAADYDGTTYRSTDRGVTWTPTSGGLPTFGGTDVAAATSGTLFAVGDSNLVTSTNDGATWQSVAGMGNWLQVEPLPSGELLLGRSDGLWRRSAGGSYTQVGAAQVTSRVDALYHAADGRWLAATEAGIYRGEANLATWTLVAAGVVGVQEFLPQPGGGALAVGVRGVARSDAQLQNWQDDMNGFADPLLSGVAVSATSVFVATPYGEVFRSDDGATTWARRHAGLPLCQLNHLARLDNGRLFAICNRASSAAYTSVDDGASWSLQSATPRFDGIVSASASVALALQSNVGLWRSTDGGASWTRSAQAFDAESPRQLMRAGDGALWVRTNAGLYRSTNAGTSWPAAAGGLVAPGNRTLWSVAGGVLSLGGAQVHRYDAAGGSWSAFGDVYTGTPHHALGLGTDILLGTANTQLVGDAATGRWRRVENQGRPFDAIAQAADGRAYGIALFAAVPLRVLTNDRIFAHTGEQP